MSRITVTLEYDVEQALRMIQGGLISGRGHDVTYTTTINTVLVAGMIGVKDFSPKTWAAIREFLDKKHLSLNWQGMTDNYINELK